MNDAVDGNAPGGDTEAGAEWGPPVALVAVAWAATAAAGMGCVVAARTGDLAGLLLVGVAAGGLGFAAVYWTRARPRLRVDATGLVVGTLSGRRRYPWAQVGTIRVGVIRRLGRTTTLLEIDVGESGDDVVAERLLVFDRFDLDADPDDVAAAVRAARSRSS